MNKLVIISHTEHQLDSAGQPVGWAPTVNEINYLADYFDEVEHVACLESGEAKGSSIPYTNAKIKFSPIPVFGGKTLKSKLGIILKAPGILAAVHKALKNATHVQLRLPTSIGLFLLPYFTLRNRKRYIFWVKYANNWIEPSPPPGYALQRWYLSKNFARCKVTINGSWPGQPSHCFTFENPCLNEENRHAGYIATEKKQIAPPFKLLFVGRVAADKGIFTLLEALKSFTVSEIESLTVTGSGPDENKAIEMVSGLTIPVVFTGALPQSAVHQLFEKSHFLVLPSASEGFPKVAAEAMNYGCIPILSKVGSIPFYLKHLHDSFLLVQNNADSVAKTIELTINMGSDSLKVIQKNGYSGASLFTFKSYWYKLQQTILE